MTRLGHHMRALAGLFLAGFGVFFVIGLVLLASAGSEPGLFLLAAQSLSTAGTLAFLGIVAYSVAATDRRLQVENVRVSNNPEELSARSVDAFATWKAGHPEQALAQYEELLKDRTLVMGPYHPDTLIVRNNIAFLTWKVGRPEQALDLYEALLEDTHRVYRSNHPDAVKISRRIELLRSGKPLE